MDLLVKTSFLLLGITLGLTGCNGASTSPIAASPNPSPTLNATPDASTPKAQLSPATPVVTASEPENVLISPRGIGIAQLGMTLGELKQQLGTEFEFEVKSPFIVDFDALTVKKAGEVQYHILYLAGQSFGDQDVIQGLFTSNPKFQTAEQIGAGSTIQEAQQAYGQAILSYNTQNESREYARFVNQPAGNISFGTGNGNQAPAGQYSSPIGAYNETQEFQADATIQSILVVCLTEDCVPPTPNP